MADWSSGAARRILAPRAFHPPSITAIMNRSGLLAASYLTLIALLLPATPSTAQRPETAPLRQPESVPFELAAALTSAGGMTGEPQILVGGVPGWVADRIVVPPHARILGSAFYGTTVVAILTMPAGDDSTMVGYKQELMKRGWLNPPPQPNYGGGFRPALMSAASSSNIALCGDRQSLFARLTRRGGSASNLTVRIGPAIQGSNCLPMQLPAGYPRQFMLPVVYHPEGVMDARSGTDCARQNEVNRTSAVVRSELSADALLDHYGRQLQDSGWVAGTKRTSMTGRTFTRPDSAGTPMEITLTVSSGETGCRELNMTLFGKRPQ
ncbi:hypothetical protein BH09GEM1_BH09GEM1_14040 [soil metagenome]